jgi:hypothetical protein
MKKIILIAMLAICASCANPKLEKQVEELRKDCVQYQEQSLELSAKNVALLEYTDSLMDCYLVEIKQLNDSIATLNKKPLMTKEQFIKLYKYESLLKYYKICKNNSSQWVYYRGWSTRVFEE